MEPLYPIADHVLLSAAAGRLDAEVLDAQTVLAEEVLGLSGTSFTGDDKDKAMLANVLQVNHQLLLPADAFIYKSESRGGRSVAYRDGVTAVMINPAAQVLVDSLVTGATVAGRWGTFGPRR